MPDPHPPDRARGVAAIALVLAAVLVAGAFAAGRSTPGAAPAHGPVPTGVSRPTLASGPVDVGFAQDMLDHHQQALQMAMLAVGRASTTPVRSLALAMVATQQDESGRFRQFLQDRGHDEGEPGREVMGWMGHPMPYAQMPGLLPPERIVALTNAEGRDFDRLFLELMIEHHRGAAEMAEHALGHGESPFTRDMADRILVHQRRELTDLESLLPGFTP